MTIAAPPTVAVDEHDERRLSLVHPPHWTDLVPRDRYDLVVLGAGTGGLVCAAGAAGLGARVALVEEHLMGGDCLNVGCVPSKAVIAAARAWRAARHAADFGGPPVAGDGDFAAAMARMRRLRADLSPLDSAARFTQLGVDVFLGRGQFTARDRLAVNGRELRFRRAVIATGARAAAPPIPGLAEADYLTNETVFSLTSLPQWLVVVGAGPVGCELAQAFARLGSSVTLLDQATRVLPREDPDASAILERALVADEVHLQLGLTLERIERVGGRDGLVRIRGRRGPEPVEVLGDALLVATGRAPNVDGLGLEAAGVAFERSGITVDDRLRTTNRRIFAVGDVCSANQFTHAADFQARLVLANALFFGRGRESRLVYPRCTYTSPEVAHVGLLPDEAEQRGLPVQTITIPFREVDRAVLDGETEGFLRVHLRRGSDRILGLTIVDAVAGELISEAAVALTNSLGLSRLGRTMHAYPTRAEAYRKAADAWRRERLTPRVRRLLGWWFRIFR